MKGWQTVALGELFDITSSKRVFQSEWQDSGVPFYRAREIVRLVREGFVQNELFISEEMYESYKLKYGVPNPGDLLITGVGTLGICYVVRHGDRFYFKDGNIIWLKNKGLADPRYVYHALLIPEIKRKIEQSSGTTVGTFTIQRANEIKIPLPSLPEQKRIAAILDKADAIRRKREKAIELTDSFLRSVFLEMFGDPVSNPKNWREVSIADIAVRITKGESPKWQGFDYQESGVLFVTSENVRVGFTQVLKPKFIPEAFHQKLSRSQLRRGDLLINLVGASIGGMALFDMPGVPQANINQAVAAVSLDDSQVVPEFLLHQLLSYSKSRQLIGQSVEAARANLSLTNVRQCPVILPPIEEQIKWQKVVNKMSSLRLNFAASQSDITRLATSFSHSLFSETSKVNSQAENHLQELAHAL